MSIEIVRARKDRLDDMARICYEAFKGISEAHGFPTDFTSVELARQVLAMLLHHAHVVMAVEDGRVLGSNAVQLLDEVGGIGPITVDPAVQGRGLGRRLMQAVIDEAGRQGFESLRLHQDLFNMASLSLYASLGFAVREAVLVMEARPATEVDPSVRPVTPDDLDACDALCRRHYGFSRRRELSGLLAAGMDARLRLVDGVIVAYQMGGFPGHGMAESPEHTLAVMGQIARDQPPPANMFLVPLRNDRLHHEALRQGARGVKPMSYMSYGPYREPSGTWLPSISM